MARWQCGGITKKKEDSKLNKKKGEQLLLCPDVMAR